jgi:protein-disulfide isomerase
VRFDAELDSSKYAAVVRKDLDDGATYGIQATPTVFINGVMLKELTAAALNTAIERAMTTATPR